jgi:anti-sigma28 factor (negative regulator of flagellin synthesis)
MDSLPKLRTAYPGERARPAPSPSADRLRELARAVAAGAYRVSPERVAESLIRTAGPPARRD